VASGVRHRSALSDRGERGVDILEEMGGGYTPNT
jgi:hypothetical protein